MLEEVGAVGVALVGFLVDVEALQKAREDAQEELHAAEARLDEATALFNDLRRLKAERRTARREGAAETQGASRHPVVWPAYT